MKTKCTITTFTGIEFDILNPTEDMISNRDICSALSKICRFGGHTKNFYSVAEHSLVGSLYIQNQYRLEFLLHDATEAYIGDLVTPLKGLVTNYKDIESNMDRVIRGKFNLPEVHSPQIKEMDLKMLAREKLDLLIDNNSEWEMLNGIIPVKSCSHFSHMKISAVAEYMENLIKKLIGE